MVFKVIYVCVHVCECICMYVCVCVCVCICMCVCICLQIVDVTITSVSLDCRRREYIVSTLKPTTGYCGNGICGNSICGSSGPTHLVHSGSQFQFLFVSYSGSGRVTASYQVRRQFRNSLESQKNIFSQILKICLLFT